MAYYFGRRRYYYRRRPYYYYRRRGFYKRYARKYFRRYVNGSSRSRVKVKVPFTYDAAFTVAANTFYSNFVHPITPWINDKLDGEFYPPMGALSSPLFRQYCNLYEEVKCEGIKVKINMTSPIGSGGLPAATLTTAVDRKWTDAEHQAAWPTPANLEEYGTSQKITFINNKVDSVTRSVYASDLIEKISFIDTDYTLNTAHTSDTHAGHVADYMNAYVAAGANVGGFSPCIMMGLKVGAAPAANTYYGYHLEGFYYFTFRNPKYGAAAAKIANRGVVVHDVPDDGDDGAPPADRLDAVDVDQMLDEATRAGNVVRYQPEDHHPNE